MAENSAIEWTDSTVNFWWGCTKVGPGCYHCYAETWSKRTGESIWGPGIPRRKIKSAVGTLYKMQNKASWWAADYAIGKIHDHPRRRVFIQSMSDLFDNEVPEEWFTEAYDAIRSCDSLDIQIVTKRVSFVEKRLAGRPWPQNAGLIISVVNQAEAYRDIPRLRALKAKLGIPWVGLSMEPLLGPVDLTDIDLSIVDWVIVGGESGKSARPMHPDWARSLRDQCAAANVPFFFKQWGEWGPAGCVEHEGIEDINRGFTKWDYGHFDWCGRFGLCALARSSSGHVDEAYGLNHSDTPDVAMWRVGKKRAGRLLDDVEHNGYPEVSRG